MKISKHKPVRPYKRKLHLDGEVWTYRVVSTFIQLRNPTNTVTYNISSFELHDISEGEWYENDDPARSIPDPPVTPRMLIEFTKKLIAQSLK